MPNVFLLYMPPGNNEAMVHYQDTIKNRVSLGRISPHVRLELRVQLTSVFGAAPIAVWGSQAGSRNRGNFERMLPGDDVLIVEGKSIKLIGKIAAKVDSAELSRELWKPITGQGDTNWRLIYRTGFGSSFDVLPSSDLNWTRKYSSCHTKRSIRSTSSFRDRIQD